jgi:hypothetical protein
MDNSDHLHLTKDSRPTFRGLRELNPVLWELVESAHPDAAIGEQHYVGYSQRQLHNGMFERTTFITERVDRPTFYQGWVHHAYVEVYSTPIDDASKPSSTYSL